MMENIELDQDLVVVIQTFVEKILKFDSKADANTTTETLREHLEVVENLEGLLLTKLRSIKVEKTKETLKLIQESFDIFIDSVSSRNLKIIRMKGRMLLKLILTEMGKVQCGKLMLNIYTNLCIKNLESITCKCGGLKVEQTSHLTVVVQSLSCVAEWISRNWSCLFKCYSCSLYTSVSQISKCLPLLLKAINLTNAEMIKYVSQRTKECFEQLRMIINDDDKVTEKNGCEFMYLIDALLDMLKECENEPSLESVKVLKPIIDETLCYAMSVAQIAVQDTDYKTIVACCNKVLEEYQTVFGYVEEKNLKYKWSCSCLEELMCGLEERVNVAVLCLYLEVFSDMHTTLKTLIQYCVCESVTDDWNKQVEQFDIQMDRVMQIGLFAISCSTDSKRKVEIRSCLASLESLEAELIPTLGSLRAEKNDDDQFKLQMLVDHWFNETSTLQVLIDGIVDPAAFCKVVEEKVVELFNEYVQLCNKQSNPQNLTRIIQGIVQRCKKLLATVHISLDTSQLTPDIQKSLKGLESALISCKELTKSPINVHHKPQTKKLRVLIVCVSRVKDLLNVMMESEVEVGTSLLFPDSVKDLSFDKDESSVVLDQQLLAGRKEFCKIACVTPDRDLSTSSHDFTKAENQLTPFLMKGKLLSKERTILYNTPKSSKVRSTQRSEFLGRSSVNSARRSTILRNRKLPLQTINDDTADSIDINSILDNISQLSATFFPACTTDWSNMDQQLEPAMTTTGCCAKLDCNHVPPGTSSLNQQLQGTFSELSTSADVFCPSGLQFDTLEREKDLRAVEEKLSQLKQ